MSAKGRQQTSLIASLKSAQAEARTWHRVGFSLYFGRKLCRSSDFPNKNCDQRSGEKVPW